MLALSELIFIENVQSLHISISHCFCGEHERGRKQRDFAPKNAVHFVSKLNIFHKVESDVGENLGRRRTDVYQSMN